MERTGLICFLSEQTDVHMDIADGQSSFFQTGQAVHSYGHFYVLGVGFY